MKISPVSSTIIPTADASGAVQPGRVESYRTFKMATNATPLANQTPMQNGAIQNVNTTQEVVEATQPLSPQLALLAKQRRANQLKERDLAEREKKFQEKANAQPSIEISRLKSEPLRVLLENGITYDQLTEAIMNGQGGNSDVEALKAEINSLRQGIDQKFTEKATAEEQQVLAAMRRDADQLVRASDEYELVRETRSTPKVMELIEKTYRATGEVLDVSEALKLVEEELFKDAQRIIKSKKLQSQFAPIRQQPMPPQQRAPMMRTLTNRDTAQVPMSAKQRAMAAFYGTLKH